MRSSTQALARRCATPRLSTAFGLLGKRWNGIILGALRTGPAGFAEIRRAIGSITDSMLSDRLGELCAAGMVAAHGHRHPSARA